MEKRPNRELTLLYPLRKPFSSIAVHVANELDDFVQLSLDINGQYAGSLRIAALGLSNFLLHVLADTNHPVGHIVDGRVEWAFEPEAFKFFDVIDDNGRLLNALSLPR